MTKTKEPLPPPHVPIEDQPLNFKRERGEAPNKQTLTIRCEEGNGVVVAFVSGDN
jgi:hypothetical protein